MTRARKSDLTRNRILEAASGLFAAKSFDGVSIRAIARRAEVDPALVHHYFGTKDDLFNEVLSHAASPGTVFEQFVGKSPEALGAEILRTALGLIESPAGPALKALMRSGISSHPELLQRFVTKQLIGRVIPLLDVPEDERALRATLAGSQFVGLFVARYLVKVEPLASLSREEVVRLVAPNVQRYLTGEL